MPLHTRYCGDSDICSLHVGLLMLIVGAPCQPIVCGRCRSASKKWGLSSRPNRDVSTAVSNTTVEWRDGPTSTTIPSMIHCSVIFSDSSGSRGTSILAASSSRQGDLQTFAGCARDDGRVASSLTGFWAMQVCESQPCAAAASFAATSGGSVSRRIVPPCRFSSEIA